MIKTLSLAAAIAGAAAFGGDTCVADWGFCTEADSACCSDAQSCTEGSAFFIDAEAMTSYVLCAGEPVEDQDSEGCWSFGSECVAYNADPVDSCLYCPDGAAGGSGWECTKSDGGFYEGTEYGEGSACFEWAA